jgi:hypothetical protein
MKIIIATDPAHDEVTKYLSGYVDKIVEHVQRIDGAEISLLRGADVNPEKLHELIEAKDPALILFNGHGEHDAIKGFDNIVLVSTKTSPMHLFENRIVHALSCWAGQALGQDMVDLGTKSFIGYVKPFEFYGLDSDFDEEDHIAKLFLEPANEIARLLCLGRTVEEAYSGSKDFYEKNISDIYTSTDPFVVRHKSLILSSLRKNKRSLISLGDQGASI